MLTRLTAILLCLAVSSYVFAVDPVASSGPSIRVDVNCPSCVPATTAAPQATPIVAYKPVTVYQPAYQLVPYQYAGSAITEQRYHTPIRNALFGRYRGYHFYTPLR